MFLSHQVEPSSALPTWGCQKLRVRVEVGRECWEEEGLVRT